MKGIILAGGKGSRLNPLTIAVNKQLLPIYDKPMIYYPLSVLMLAFVKEILIITNPNDLSLYKKLLGDGKRYGINITYEIQEKPNGIAQAFSIGKDFIKDDDVCLILGDNIFYGQGFSDQLNLAIENIKKGYATIFGYYVNNPCEFGVVNFDEENNVLDIVEKPKNPKSHYAVPGLYFYPNNVVNYVNDVCLSDRNEYEITSLNNLYLKNKKLKVELMGRGLAWLDTGTYDGLLNASNYVRTIQEIQGLYIACLEEIAYRQGFIDKKQLLENAKFFEKTDYGKYLKKIAKE